MENSVENIHGDIRVLRVNHPPGISIVMYQENLTTKFFSDILVEMSNFTFFTFDIPELCHISQKNSALS